MVIAVDFDGTIVEHRYPEIGREIPFATDTLRMLIAEQHKLILWSVREGKLLDDAVAWCKERGVTFYAVNKDFPEEKVENNNHFSRKIKADLFIDDRNIGGLPDWARFTAWYTTARPLPPCWPKTAAHVSTVRRLRKRGGGRFEDGSETKKTRL